MEKHGDSTISPGIVNHNRMLLKDEKTRWMAGHNERNNSIVLCKMTFEAITILDLPQRFGAWWKLHELKNGHVNNFQYYRSSIFLLSISHC